MKRIFDSFLSVVLLFSCTSGAFADVKIRQRMTMGGQTFESTKMIRGARQRTEQKSEAGGGAADFMAQVATLEQCDLRRTVLINDRKKLYFIEPFAETSSTTNNPSIQNPQSKNQNQKGGTVTIFYSVTDTGERRTLFGLAARHLTIVQEMESSPDSCGGASKSKMEIDGWYVDFSAEFNCPVEIPTPRGIASQPTCRDRVIYKTSGARQTGFLLNGTTVFYDASGNQTVSQTIETLELSRAPLAAALFEIPADYKPVGAADELYTMPSMTDLMRQTPQNEEPQNQTTPSERGAKNIALNIAFASEAKVDQAEINRYLLEKLRGNNFNARVGAGGARSDYVLSVEVVKVKESTASKVGGIFGKVTGVETKGGKTDVELVMTLSKGDSNASLGQARVARKFDGNSTEAVKQAIDDALATILSKIEN